MKQNHIKEEIEMTLFEVSWLKKYGRKKSPTYLLTLRYLESRLESLVEKLIKLNT